MRTLANILWFIVFFALTLASAYFAAMLGPAGGASDWYDALVKPSWMPNPAAFGIVWPVLYVLSALAGWLVVIRSPGSWAVLFWVAQLVLNPYWVYLFFDQRLMTLALAELWVLWAVIGAFQFASWRHSRLASWLYVPYWVWVSFAICLNSEIVRLNP
ncbi:MAG: sensory protein TspO [Rhizobiales bacterium]|nr:sensory protein TspO [Hyphomicrobiales bacterium]